MDMEVKKRLSIAAECVISRQFCVHTHFFFLSFAIISHDEVVAEIAEKKEEGGRRGGR